MRARICGSRLVGFVVVMLLTGAMSSTAAGDCGDGVLDPGEACDDGNPIEEDCCSNDCRPQNEETSCNDGRTCTAADTCEAGVCRGVPSDPFCALPLDVFTCYGAHNTRSSGPVFQPHPGEPIADELFPDTTAPRTLDLTNTDSLCSFAAVEGGENPQRRFHLESYAASAGEDPEEDLPELDIVTRFGSVRFQPESATNVLVPTAVAFASRSAPLAPAETHRWVCYEGAAADLQPPEKITLSDFRGGPAPFPLSELRRVCSPEVLESVDVAVPRPGSLACHATKGHAAAPVKAATANRYGDEVLAVEVPREVCLPAFIVPVDTAAGLPDLRFPFLVEDGEVQRSMRVIFESGFETPSTNEEMLRSRRRVDEATLVLLAHLPETQSILAEVLGGLEADEAPAYGALRGLLRIAGDAREVLAHLSGRLEGPPDRDLREDTSLGLALEQVRGVAFDTLLHHAARGSPRARTVLLDLVAAPRADVQWTAVRLNYRVHPDRSRIQREMRLRMGPADHYILYRQ